jgi:hypothetical protein
LAELETKPGNHELPGNVTADTQVQRRIFHGALVQQSHLRTKLA